jgi:hypothetical protein
MQGFDDHAPSVPVLFAEGDVIPNLAADEADRLIAVGAVECI